MTGLRKGELASLTVGQLQLDAGAGSVAYATLKAADEKAGRGADVPLRADLAHDLRLWLADKLDALRRQASASGGPLPARLPPDTPLFYVPTGLIYILDRDLVAAGIPKRDDRGRTVDVHAMRHTFGTHLSKGGVAPRTAQAAMRRSSLDLTMNTYTDPRLLDVAGAMDALPSMPLNPGGDQRTRTSMTGTDPAPLVPMLVPKTGNGSQNLASSDKTTRGVSSPRSGVSDAACRSSQELTRHVTKRAKGLEPSTFSLEG